ncbi:hypothetical protein [Vibrio alginolyticus]|uniref:hypothetical protein n=1 Tax=Vibrio alginolyticus TaxID=663 RepID=UPI00215D2240|nr:hypothetical protein [Vibrio alginolyticus]MCR9454042.1 hypothetical protein [Vibrio alginolyticus]MCR9463930.1 hypothetical protein [Vibrio alginolyticus]
MKKLNKSTSNPYLGVAGLEHSKASILISKNIKYSKPGRRIVAPLHGKENIFEIAESHRQARIRDIEIVIDSSHHPELSSKILVENFKRSRLPIIDISTGVNFGRCSAFSALWEGYKLFPSSELATSISKYLIQKIPLQFGSAESCLQHHLDADSTGYGDLLNALQKTEKNYESLLAEKTKVTAYDKLIKVETFKNVSSIVESEKYDTTVLLGKTGTGKTQDVLRPIARSASTIKKVAYISYLIPLVKQFCDAANAVSYNSASLFEIETANALGVVVNSSSKDHLASFILNCDVLIIDEFEKVMATVCGDNETMPDKVIEVLTEAMQKVPRVVVADADVTDTTLNWLRKHRKSIQIVQASLNPYKNINVTIANKFHAFCNTSKNLKCENVILFDSLKSLRLTMIDIGLVDTNGQACEKSALAQDVIVLTGSNKALQAQAEFLRSPTTECSKYKMILASPCLASGYSCEAEYADNINVISDLVLGVDELINFSRRFRTSKHITFYLTSNHYYNYTPHHSSTKSGERELLRKEFENKKRLFNANQPLSMQWALRRLGFNVQVLQTSQEQIQEGLRRFNVLNSMDLESRVKAILEAKLITQAESDKLIFSNQVGFKEQAMLMKFEIMRDYQLHEITEHDILFDDRFKNKALFKQVWSQSKTNMDRRFSESSKLIKSLILQNPQYLGDDGKLRISREQVFSIAGQLYENKALLESFIVFGKFNREYTQNTATRLVKYLLTSLGYVWPKYGYTGNDGLVRLSMDKRAIAFKNMLQSD